MSTIHNFCDICKRSIKTKRCNSIIGGIVVQEKGFDQLTPSHDVFKSLKKKNVKRCSILIETNTKQNYTLFTYINIFSLVENLGIRDSTIFVC